MGDPVLIRLLALCIDIEKRAVMMYRKLADSFEPGGLHDFWRGMSKQEAQHVAYWKSLLELAEQRRIQNVFDEPERIESELSGICARLVELDGSWPDRMGVRTAFLFAYKAEFYVLHPSFAALFHLMRAETQEPSPEDDYEKHIGGLVVALRRYGTVDPELALIADLTARLWNRNHELAVQLADLKSLRNLVPICMHCKNVRNDKGYWDKVEHYVESRSTMQFSHGICPDCIVKYYPDLADPKK
jgi:hypothetical protein